jgi:hypothetical protein
LRFFFYGFPIHYQILHPLHSLTRLDFMACRRKQITCLIFSQISKKFVYCSKPECSYDNIIICKENFCHDSLLMLSNLWNINAKASHWNNNALKA